MCAQYRLPVTMSMATKETAYICGFIGFTFVVMLWIQQLLKAATVEGDRVPSIETFLHALCLQVDGVQFVGHTHPTVALGLLSGSRSRELFSGSIFPDQIVLLGSSFVYVPYADLWQYNKRHPECVVRLDLRRWHAPVRREAELGSHRNLVGCG